jgi:hypothetical protein
MSFVFTLLAAPDARLCVFNYLLFLSALLEGLVDHFGKRKARSP